MQDVRKDSRGRKLKVGESQRKDGLYQYRYSDMLGKRQCVYSWRLLPSDKTPDGKKEDVCLRDKEKEIELMLLQNISVCSQKYNLNDMFDRYMSTKKHKGKKLAQTTVTNYKSMWNKHVRESMLGNMKISDIKKVHIVQFYNLLLEDGVGYGTIVFFNKVLTAVFNMAIDGEMLKKNPTQRALNEIEGEHVRREALSVAQQEEFTEYLYKNNKELYRKWIFLLDTMCRVSEFAGLTWEDIDMNTGLITISNQLIYRKLDGEEYTTFHITPTKNSHSRKIPITDRLYEILREMRKYFFITRKGYEVDGKKDFVFYSKKGTLINGTNLNLELKNAVKQYNQKATNKIEHISCHVLRHTGCTRNAEDGMDIKVLQYLMGHSNTQITNNVYNHVDAERAVKELQTLENKRKMCS